MIQDLKISNDQFDFFRKKIFELAGISMSDVKIDLVQSRLRSRVLNIGLNSFEDYQSYLTAVPKDHAEWETFINLLTTNKTDWFREPEHFEYLTQEFLPHWKKTGKKKLHIWCAASSTGQEPYTLSLILNEFFRNTHYDYEIHASDIDTNVLKLAQNGVYHREQLNQIPEKFHTHFAMGSGEIEQWMKVKKQIKKPVTFFQFNLTHFEKFDRQYDLILCRNVLIYFGQQTISQVVNTLFQNAASDSVLVIAHSESLQTINTEWSFKRPSIYVKGKKYD